MLENNGESYDYLEYFDCTDFRKNISLQEFLKNHKNNKLKINIEVIE